MGANSEKDGGKIQPLNLILNRHGIMFTHIRKASMFVMLLLTISSLYGTQTLFHVFLFLFQQHELFPTADRSRALSLSILIYTLA